MNYSGRVIAGILGIAVGLFLGRIFSTGKTNDSASAGQSVTNDSEVLAKIDDGVARLVSVFEEEAETTVPGDEQIKIHSVEEAKAAISTLGDAPTAEKLASAATLLDSWSFDPADEKQIAHLKSYLVTRLRKTTKSEVLGLQEKAVNAPNGLEAAKTHAEAGRTLALFPMSDEKQVIEDAQHLSTQQVTVAARIEAIRRQRYNLWATHQIESAINGYNGNKSYWSPLKENAALIDSLVKSLGEIDPMLLEPVVLELYNYVVDLTKGSISEKDKIQLATRLADPSVRRKGLGDF